MVPASLTAAAAAVGIASTAIITAAASVAAGGIDPITSHILQLHPLPRTTTSRTIPPSRWLQPLLLLLLLLLASNTAGWLRIVCNTCSC